MDHEESSGQRKSKTRGVKRSLSLERGAALKASPEELIESLKAQLDAERDLRKSLQEENTRLKSEVLSKDDEIKQLCKRCSNLEEEKKKGDEEKEVLLEVVHLQEQEITASTEKCQQMVERAEGAERQSEELRMVIEILESKEQNLCATVSRMEKAFEEALDDTIKARAEAECYKANNLKRKNLAKLVNDKHKERLGSIVEELTTIYRGRKHHPRWKFWRQLPHQGKVESAPIAALIKDLVRHQQTDDLLWHCKIELAIL